MDFSVSTGRDTRFNVFGSQRLFKYLTVIPLVTDQLCCTRWQGIINQLYCAMIAHLAFTEPQDPWSAMHINHSMEF